jgi:hypothetical protein
MEPNAHHDADTTKIEPHHARAGVFTPRAAAGVGRLLRSVMRGSETNELLSVLQHENGDFAVCGAASVDVPGWIDIGALRP